LAGTFDLSPRLLTPFEKELCLLDNLQMTYTGRCLLTIPSGPRFLSGRLWYQISELRHAMHWWFDWPHKALLLPRLARHLLNLR